MTVITIRSINRDAWASHIAQRDGITPLCNQHLVGVAVVDNEPNCSKCLRMVGWTFPGRPDLART